MKSELPANHGLTEYMVENLVFHDGDDVSLTNIQYQALEEGVARGQSTLIVSPTSTGKTQIATWAIVSNIEQGINAVYLVTHRSLAKQKFNEFKKALVDEYFEGDGTALAIATGEYIEDATGETPPSPLEVPLLVATYEKYLALLSSNGVPVNMSSTAVICDEIQYIGDEGRGQNIEVLLTLLLNAKWKQFLGLSAVLKYEDAKELANWLQVKLIYATKREKHLSYELWTNEKTLLANTENPGHVDTVNKSNNLQTLEIVDSILNSQNPPIPIIVFCMRKQDIYSLSEAFVKRNKRKPLQRTFDFENIPATSINSFLSHSLVKRVAIHCADLLDEEREIVEFQAMNGEVDVIFASSTLAAGVNFPFGVAIFHTWSRWDFDQRKYVPIDAAEFHNMAGRVGRMGFDHEYGRVIYCANGFHEIRSGKSFLTVDNMPVLKSRISTKRFDQLSLQLISSNLCKTTDNVIALIQGTYSGLKEETQNTVAFQTWPTKIQNKLTHLAIAKLILISSDGQVQATPVGKAIAYSALLPETGLFLLNYIASKYSNFLNLLNSGSESSQYQVLFSIIHACCASPEFTKTRFLPYQIDKELKFNADDFADLLIDPNWEINVKPINAAFLTLKWINGEELSELEKLFPGIRAGNLYEMFRNLSWILQGTASILFAATDIRVLPNNQPDCISSLGNGLFELRKLVRVIRQLTFRVSEGLPEDVLWMKSLHSVNQTFNLTRTEILSLHKESFSSPEQIMLGTPAADAIRNKAFASIKPSPQIKSNWLRNTCREWKAVQRMKAKDKHVKRAGKTPLANIIEAYYDKKGTEFEDAFESVLDLLQIKFEKLDQKGVLGAPDYLLELNNSPSVIFELKSKTGKGLVDYNGATEVLAASEIHGYKDAFCVTLCHPGVDPSVASVITKCGRLSVVESHDLGEAFVRMAEGRLTQEQLWHWLATPGQALMADIPFKEN